MLAVRCHRWMPYRELEIEDIPAPAVGPGQVRVAVHYAGMSFATSLVTEGRYQRKPPLPFTPGTEATLAATPPPWSLPGNARPFIAAAGLQVLGQEALSVHYHAHLDIIVNGSAVPVPADLGFVIANGQGLGITVLHTHDTSGIVHIESPTNSPYTLGQFFTEWGVRLGPGEIGGLTNTNGNALRVYVDGKVFSGDPASIVLRSYQEIALWYGPTTTTPQVPSTYQFPSGD